MYLLKYALFAVTLWVYALGAAAAAAADDSAPDKGDYWLLNPTPEADLRSFNTDRPPKANSP